MGKPVYIASSGEIRREGNTLLVILQDGTKRRFPIENISEVYFLGEGSITKKALQLLALYKAPLHVFSYNGHYIGTFYPREHLNSGYILLKQVEHYTDMRKRLVLAISFVEGAYHNSRQVITYYLRRLRDEEVKNRLQLVIESMDRFFSRVPEVKTINELMGLEAEIKRAYFSAFDDIILQEGMEFAFRSRRPPSNEVNALLGFMNSLLYAVVLDQIYMTHLDPRIGYLHETNFRAFSLNLDVAEVFKPVLVDRLLFSLINRRTIRREHFREEAGGLLLTQDGMNTVIRAWERRLEETVTINRRRISYRRLIRKELYKIERHLIGDEFYRPYRMK